MFIQETRRWLASPFVGDVLKENLIAHQEDQRYLQECFQEDLRFGTGGIRGVMGPGSGKMNECVVARATTGLATYLLNQVKTPHVCIAYDTRHQSRLFAEVAVGVLCAAGIHAYIFPEPRPTPMLSYAVRYTQADAGIVITASHNPKEYNGYKVYGYDGGQITDVVAQAIWDRIQERDLLESFPSISMQEAQRHGLLTVFGEDIEQTYYQSIEEILPHRSPTRGYEKELRIVYTPLHGTGNPPTYRLLTHLGYQLEIPPEQWLPDGNFPTAAEPNPENPAVFRLAMALADRTGADVIFATDPDCDRIGVAARGVGDTFELLTGNQIGALLCEYLILAHKEMGTLPANAAVIKTIVTTELAREICEYYGISLFDTLTGFKYIGELAQQWQHTGQYAFLLGFEESYGYLAGDFVRDKDAVIAAALIAEMTLYHKLQGRTLHDALKILFEKYGFFEEKRIFIPADISSTRIDLDRVRNEIMQASNEAQQPIAFYEDYLSSVRYYVQETRQEPISLPISNVIRFVYVDGSQITVRPSGTEPRIKTYVETKGMTREDAIAKMEKLERICNLS